jgi:DNA segregation ATPase FtsK/SpoIIIE-like protein
VSVLRVRLLEEILEDPSVLFARRAMAALAGLALLALSVCLALSLASWDVSDPSLTHATSAPVTNWMGHPGAAWADPIMQIFGLAAPLLVAPLPLWGWRLLTGRPVGLTAGRLAAGFGALLLAPGFLNVFPTTQAWPLPQGLGGVVGEMWGHVVTDWFGIGSGAIEGAVGGLFGVAAAALLVRAVRPVRRSQPIGAPGFQIRRQAALYEDEYGLEDTDTYEAEPSRLAAIRGALAHAALSIRARWKRRRPTGKRDRTAPSLRDTLADANHPLPGDPSVYRSSRRRAPALSDDDFLPETHEAVTDEGYHADEAANGYREADDEPELFAPARPVRRVPREERAATAPPREAPAEPRGRAWRERPAEASFASFQLPMRGPAARLSQEAIRQAASGSEPPAHGDASPIDGTDHHSMHADDAWRDEAPWQDLDHDDGSARENGADAAHGPNVDGPNGATNENAEDEPHTSPWTDDWDEGEDDWDEGGEDWDDPFAAEAARHAEAPTERPAPAPRRPLPTARQDSGSSRVTPAAGAMKPGRRVVKEAQPSFLNTAEYEFPPLALLAAPKVGRTDDELTEESLEANARVLEGVLEDFGVKGQIIHVRPGPVVTLYELEPAPGIKSSRVIGLADDIARSMASVSARVAVIPGKNAIGIELPNRKRVTVFLRELLASQDFERTKARLPLCLGKTIGGEAVIADLARMPHLLVAGTTGSGKSVSINTMILSLLYWHQPEQCRIILIDPKMLELSVYDGIPHLLTPVVTDPKKAVSALRWAVREMEERYQKMAKLGVRNIDGYNARVREAQKDGQPLTRLVQTGFDKATGEAIFEEEVLDLEPMPFIVVVVDEMADLMMVAGKDIEGAIQRLAQMARAAGIHLIMATQRPSVDVITGTIKANFPTRISFQVTSKVDSRTILGEMGAEQLLGMGDMLFMAGGGRIQRVHGPFVSDEEVEDVVAHMKRQGAPDYLLSVLEEDEDGGGESGGGSLDGMSESDDLYDRAVALVLRDRKASTSYVQRRLSIGYNRAATLIERMEREGVVSPANHAGKREILVPAEGEAA